MDELENEFGNQLLIIRLNIQDRVGRELAPVYMFEFTPTFIFFDAQGVELWREVGSLDTKMVRDALK